MPFSDEFSNTREAIVNALTHCKIDYIIMDKEHFTGKIIDEIYTKITNAHFIIADISIVATDMFIKDKYHLNSNVCYEVGYARGLGKPIIFVSDSVRETAFDLAGYNQIKYDKKNTGDLKETLITRIGNIIEKEIKKSIICFTAEKLKDKLDHALADLKNSYEF